MILALIGFGMVCSDLIPVQLLGAVIFVVSLNNLGKEIESDRGE